MDSGFGRNLGWIGSGRTIGLAPLRSGSYVSEDCHSAHPAGVVVSRCVLTVIGYVDSVDDVADKFETWWQTEKAVRRANAILEDLIGLRESGAYYVSERDMDMAYYRLEVATEARDAARAEVSSATGTSWATLGAAALACGASALLPTP